MKSGNVFVVIMQSKILDFFFLEKENGITVLFCPMIGVQSILQQDLSRSFCYPDRSNFVVA